LIFIYNLFAGKRWADLNIVDRLISTSIFLAQNLFFKKLFTDANVLGVLIKAVLNAAAKFRANFFPIELLYV
jgi:hypothetical protein